MPDDILDFCQVPSANSANTDFKTIKRKVRENRKNFIREIVTGKLENDENVYLNDSFLKFESSITQQKSLLPKDIH